MIKVCKWRPKNVSILIKIKSLNFSWLRRLYDKSHYNNLKIIILFVVNIYLERMFNFIMIWNHNVIKLHNFVTIDFYSFSKFEFTALERKT